MQTGERLRISSSFPNLPQQSPERHELLDGGWLWEPRSFQAAILMHSLILAFQPRRAQFRQMLAQVFQFLAAENDFGFWATGHATAF
jgi:hypothetical protein